METGAVDRKLAQAALKADYDRAAAGRVAGPEDEAAASVAAAEAAADAAVAEERAALERERDSAAVAAALAASRAPGAGEVRPGC